MAQSPNEELLKAAETGRLESIRSALAEGAEIEARDSRGGTKNYTALMLAAAHGRLQAAIALLDHGADLKACDDGEKIPAYLLNNVDDPSTLQDMGFSFKRSPLLLALIHGHGELARELLRRGADHTVVSYLGEEPVGLAAAQNDLETLQQLKEAGAKLDRSGREGQTPLLAACEAGAVEAVRWLLQNKARLDRKNREKESALHIAARECHPEIVEALLAAGADLEAESNFGVPLTAATGAVKKVPYKDGDPQFLSVTWGADGATTYAPVEEERVLKIVEMLLRAGADPNQGKHQTPLGSASQCGHLRVVEALLKAGARKFATDGLGNRAQDLAKMFGHHKVEAFLEAWETSEPIEPDTEENEVEYPEARFAPLPRVKKKLQSKAFKKALQELEELCQTQAMIHEHHAECQVDSDIQSERTVSQLQSRFAELGFFLADVSPSVAKPVKLALFPTPHWEDAVAIMGTNGINFQVGSQDVIDWLHHWQEILGLKVLALMSDTVGGEFLKTAANPEELAASMYEFCPDIVDQGYGDLEALAESLAGDRTFFFWWD